MQPIKAVHLGLVEGEMARKMGASIQLRSSGATSDIETNEVTARPKKIDFF
jgi:hypothetical protein